MGASGVNFLPVGFAGGEAAGKKAMIDVLRKLCNGTANAGVDLRMHNHGIIRRRQTPLSGAGLVVGGHHDLEARSVAEELAMKESGCDFIATAATLDQSFVESSFGAGFGCQDKSRASQSCEIVGDGVIPLLDERGCPSCLAIVPIIL